MPVQRASPPVDIVPSIHGNSRYFPLLGPAEEAAARSLPAAKRRAHFQDQTRFLSGLFAAGFLLTLPHAAGAPASRSGCADRAPPLDGSPVPTVTNETVVVTPESFSSNFLGTMQVNPHLIGGEDSFPDCVSCSYGPTGGAGEGG
ncbi:MAG: hypothetical protein AAF633_13830 [Chloroflexota bacterium]